MSSKIDRPPLKIDITDLAIFYHEKMKGKNWGSWPCASTWPQIGDSYSINQFDASLTGSDTYDIIRFYRPVELLDLDHLTVIAEPGFRFILSGQRPTPHTPVPVNGSVWINEDYK